MDASKGAADAEPQWEPFPGAAEPSLGSRLAHACRVLAVPLLVGLAVRLLLFPLTSWAKDDSIWWLASVSGVQHLGLYQRLGFSYPPLWGDLLAGLGWALQHAGLHASALGHTNLALEPLSGANDFSTIVTTPLFNVCFKAILVLFDLATGLALFEITRRATGNDRHARVAFCLWFLNPLVIFESGVFGAFDLIVAFLVLAAIVLFLSGRYAWTGVALAAAIMAKGSPAFLLPLFFFTAFDQGGDTVGTRVRKVVPLAVGLVVTLAVLSLPLMASGQLSTAINSVFARTGGARSGGFSVFGVLNFRGLSSLANTIDSWPSFGQLILALQVALSVGLGLVGTRQARRDMAFGVVAMSGLILLGVVMLGPLGNPQYVLWFLPELVLLVALWRRGAWALGIFSLVPLAYLMALYGPAAVLFPMASHGIVSPAALRRDIFSWINMRPLFWSPGGGNLNFDGPLTLLALTGLISALRAVLWLPTPRRRRLKAAIGATSAGVVPALATVVAVTVLAGGLVGAATPGASVQLTAGGLGHGTTVVADVHPGASLEQLRLVSFPTARSQVPSTVDIYVDRSYPVVGTTPDAVAAIANSMSSDLRLRGYRGAVHQINAAGLRQLLEDRTSAASTALVDMSGILPATVFSASTDLVSPWLDAGGTIYWGGEPIGYFSGQSGQGDNQPSYPGSLGGNGVAHFFDPVRISAPLPQPYTMGAVPSGTARAMSLRFRFNALAPTLAPASPAVTPVGWTSQSRSSITEISEGKGQLVMLGGLIYNQRLVAPDLELLVLSGITWSQGPISSVNVPRHVVDQGGVVRWSVPGTGSSRQVVLAFDPTDAGIVFVRTVHTSP